MRRMFAVLAVCVAVAVLSGCPPKNAKMDPRVAQNWAQMMQEMKIAPTFPPREDIQPGDIYTVKQPMGKKEDGQGNEQEKFALASGDKSKDKAAVAQEDTDDLSISVFIGTISAELRPKIREHYRQRFAFPETIIPPVAGAGGQEDTPATDKAKDKDAKKASAVQPARSTVEKADVFNSQVIDRLPYVAFPEFSVSRASSVEAGALFPIEAVAVSAGFFASDVKSVSLKLENASSYGLPQTEVIKALTQKWGTKDKKIAFPSGWEEFWRKGTYAYLITEVFLVREIEASITMDKSSGFSAAAQVGKTNPQTGESSISAEATNAGKQLESLNKNLASLGGTGGRLQVLAVSANSVAMKRILPYPVVVGYKYIPLKREEDGTISWTAAFETIDNGVPVLGGKPPIILKKTLEVK